VNRGCFKKDHSGRNATLECPSLRFTSRHLCPSGAFRLDPVGVLLSTRPTDAIQFTNGDRITCEIIRLEKGYLYVRLLMRRARLDVDWSKVAHVESPQTFVVADKRGVRYTGTLHESGWRKRTRRTGRREGSGRGILHKPLILGQDIVEIDQTDTNFWQTSNGDLNAGLNTPSNKTHQYNFIEYQLQRTKWSDGSKLSTSFSGGGNISDLRMITTWNVTRQLLSPRNFYQRDLRNFCEQRAALDLRTTLGGAVGTCVQSTITVSRQYWWHSVEPRALFFGSDVGRTETARRPPGNSG